MTVNLNYPRVRAGRLTAADLAEAHDAREAYRATQIEPGSVATDDQQEALWVARFPNGQVIAAEPCTDDEDRPAGVIGWLFVSVAVVSVLTAWVRMS